MTIQELYQQREEMTKAYKELEGKLEKIEANIGLEETVEQLAIFLNKDPSKEYRIYWTDSFWAVGQAIPADHQLSENEAKIPFIKINREKSIYPNRAYGSQKMFFDEFIKRVNQKLSESGNNIKIRHEAFPLTVMTKDKEFYINIALVDGYGCFYDHIINMGKL